MHSSHHCIRHSREAEAGGSRRVGGREQPDTSVAHMADDDGMADPLPKHQPQPATTLSRRTADFSCVMSPKVYCVERTLLQVIYHIHIQMSSKFGKKLDFLISIVV